MSAESATISEIQPPSVGEKSQQEIFVDIFGGTFTQAGNDFSNGSIDLTRVDDDADQSFDLAEWTARALFSFSDADQSFGTLAEGKLFDAVGQHGPVTGSVSGAGGEAVVFGRFTYQDTFTDQSKNRNGTDQVVTYTYTTEEGKTAYLLFFEDNDTETSDFDYNDLVVEVIENEIRPSVPEPGSLALIGIGAVVILYRRR